MGGIALHVQINHQSLVRDRVSWVFSLLTIFDGEVTAEEFEDEMLSSPPQLVRDADHTQQVTLNLIETLPEHPPQQEAENGSQFQFVFEATLSPR